MDTDELETAAFDAYANRDFREAVNLLSQIVNKEPSSPRWLEMRAQVSTLHVVDHIHMEQKVKTPARGLLESPQAAYLLAGRYNDSIRYCMEYTRPKICTSH